MAVPKLSKVQAKGQITIPVAMRQKLGLEKGDVVAFVDARVLFDAVYSATAL